MKKLLLFICVLFFTNNLSAQTENAEQIVERVISQGTKMTPEELKIVEAAFAEERKTATPEDIAFFEEFLASQRGEKVDPNSAIGKMQQLEEMKYKCSEMPTDNGMSGEFHKANVGKIVFSKSEIVKGKENASAMTNSFTSADNIYARVYMAHSLQYECANMGMCFNNSSNTFYRFTVDGGAFSFSKTSYSSGTSTFNSAGEELLNKWTTWQPAMSPASKEGYGTAEMQFFYSMLEFLPEGSHKIKLEIFIDIPEDRDGGAEVLKQTTKFGPEKVVAVGEFTLNVKSADKPKVKAKTGTFSKAELDKQNEDAFTSTMTSKGVWLINKCSKSVTVKCNGESVTVSANSSVRKVMSEGQLVTSSSGSLLKKIDQNPQVYRIDVNVCQ
jgi:hypothetical protein